ncbi:hypothetical protein GOP47_0003259 [Adiantum capillus-veneris]|uniref:Uncharacterized protein n=1 Tax=Adiantum capillus-veneris TaxID=13818 RepID=A0A9D4ZRN6_ADICA|nr:hypothetical protein GOP47_0003259 [Adiantum capillus-veneris]
MMAPVKVTVAKCTGVAGLWWAQTTFSFETQKQLEILVHSVALHCAQSEVRCRSSWKFSREDIYSQHSTFQLQKLDSISTTLQA